MTTTDHSAAVALVHALDTLSLSLYRHSWQEARGGMALDHATARALAMSLALTSITPDVLRHAADLLAARQ